MGWEEKVSIWMCLQSREGGRKKRIGDGDANEVSLVRSRANSMIGGPAAKTKSEWEYKRCLDETIVKRATDGEESERGSCMCVVSEEGRRGHCSWELSIVQSIILYTPRTESEDTGSLSSPPSGRLRSLPDETRQSDMISILEAQTPLTLTGGCAFYASQCSD